MSLATVRYPFWDPQVGPVERNLVQAVLDSHQLDEGRFTAEFEGKIAELLGCRHAVAVTSGTAALFMALVALDVGPGDEVIVPDVACAATANAVTMTGATPVLVDVDPATVTLCPRAAAGAINSQTRAIVPVHVSGRAAAMDALGEIATAHGLHVVEDAAEGILSRDRGRPLGTIGRVGIFSLAAGNSLNTGQGGLLVTNDDELHQRLRELKDQGRPHRGSDEHVAVGFNFKFTDLQAAVGLGQLGQLGLRCRRLLNNYERYAQNLRHLPALALYGFGNGQVPQWIDVCADDRDALEDHLRRHGAQCRRLWRPLHTLEPYRQPDDAFPIASQLAERSMWLPSAFTLSTNDIDEVCGIVRSFYEAEQRVAMAA
ncbi:MAG TPA: DegT/DnrJ/EryC1/StrS family aminotransferase [Tepidisphaeraceae bacterium]|nr:DegT/DnrJ/EryC1/StrS family aminotransferase [Tepidisphaeraceae bacterium]